MAKEMFFMLDSESQQPVNTVPLSYSNHQPQQNVPHEHDLVVANWKMKQTIQMSFSALTMLILWTYNVADILISLRAKCTYNDQTKPHPIL